MIKYELLAEQLVYEGTVNKEQFFHPELLKEETILKTHTAEYWESLKNQTIAPKAVRKIGFPMTAHLVKRGRVISQGTIDCALYAMKYGVSLNIAGGTHHAFTDRGEGFCVLNDMAIASTWLLDQQLVSRIMIVDLDVHQGNGTAEIFKDNPSVFTFSMHGANNYPLHKATSDLDIPMPDGTGDAVYLEALNNHLPDLLDTFRPELVFYLSGVDVLASDKLGRLGMTVAGCLERDSIVFRACAERGLPVAVSMGGGYSERISVIVDAHANTYRTARNVFDL